MSGGGIANIIKQVQDGGIPVGSNLGAPHATIPGNTDPVPYLASINPRYVSAQSNNGLIPLSAFKAYKSAGMQGANDVVRGSLLGSMTNDKPTKNRGLPSPSAGK